MDDNICIECKVRPKAPKALKYCTECRIESNKRTTRASDKRLQQRRRMKNYSECAECKEIFTYTKYCRKCSQAVRIKNNAIRVKIKREEEKPKCERCGSKDKWSNYATTKYCMECKVIVQKAKVQEKNMMRDRGKKKVRKERKTPVHKGIRLDPTSQKPKIKTPKLKTEEGKINPYFLRRGDPTKNGSSGGYTQFNQE